MGIERKKHKRTRRAGHEGQPPSYTPTQLHSQPRKKKENKIYRRKIKDQKEKVDCIYLRKAGKKQVKTGHLIVIISFSICDLLLSWVVSPPKS